MVSTKNPGHKLRRETAKPGQANRKAPNRYTPEAAKETFLVYRNEGLTIDAALEKVGRSRKTYELWRRQDADFKAKADQATALLGTRKANRVKGEKLDFVTFRERYLKTETFLHQQQWIDVLEGREPRDLHPSQTYIAGKKSRVLINVPPFHAKTVTLTMDYVVYRLCMDPSFRVIVVSESGRLAEDFLAGIKQRLTHPDYIDLQLAYAPDGGWKQTADSWKQTRIVVGADGRDAAEKDPSVQAIGMGGQIYGSRCDMVIVDDAVTGKNVREFEKQMSWLRREVSSRIEMGGKLLVVGTRIAPIDLYSELMNPDNYANGRPPWTYMASPAILEEGPTPDQHVTLWPYADQPWQNGEDSDECDCGRQECIDGVEIDGRTLYPRWDGIHLEIGPRADNNVAEWALVYQQKAMHEHMVFQEHAVMESVNGSRMPGPLQDGAPGHPLGGNHHMYVVAGCDPSIKGYAGLVIVAFDRRDGKRYLLNAINMKAPTPDQLRQEMYRITDKYRVNEWRVEKTGLLQFFTQDEAMRLWFQQRGVLFNEHNTSAQTKWDPAYGVASCASLFGAYERVRDKNGMEAGWRQVAPPLIELPNRSGNPSGVKDLIHQLVTWTPQLDPKKVPCDLVMALWFVEVRCRDLVIRKDANAVNPLKRFGRYSSRRSQNGRTRVHLADYMTRESA